MSAKAMTNNDAKPFRFQSLVPDEKGKAKADQSDAFKFSNLNAATREKNEITDDKLRAERKAEGNSPFKISEAVREARGINRQEKNDYEERVTLEIDKKFSSVRELGYNEGFLIGKKEGYAQAYSEALEVFNQKIDVIGEFVDEFKRDSAELFEMNKAGAYNIIKNLAKWVILKEVSDQGYLPKLLEKMILEINNKSNLLVKVSAEHFEEMPEVIELVEKRLGKLTNCRLEVSHDMQGKGIILETENGILDASIQAQFENIDRVFTTVGLVNGQEP